MKPPEQPDPQETARREAAAHLLLAEIDRALAAGTQHFDPETNELLRTPLQIVECLLRHGSVRFTPVRPDEN